MLGGGCLGAEHLPDPHCCSSVPSHGPGGRGGGKGLILPCPHAASVPPPQDIRNTVGNIPMEWYEDFPHIGYDLDGRKIYKPIRNKDELDKFLEKMENPDYW